MIEECRPLLAPQSNNKTATTKHQQQNSNNKTATTKQQQQNSNNKTTAIKRQQQTRYSTKITFVKNCVRHCWKRLCHGRGYVTIHKHD